MAEYQLFSNQGDSAIVYCRQQDSSKLTASSHVQQSDGRVCNMDCAAACCWVEEHYS